jgi:hypothetical protein
MSKLVLLSILGGLLTSSIMGQPPDKKIVLSPGLSYQGQFLGEMNLMQLKGIRSRESVLVRGPRIGLEFNFNTSHFIYAPKIGYEWTFIFFTLRGNVISYVDQRKIDLRFLPEIGLSMIGYANLTYGYNVPLLNFKSAEIDNHRITFTINIDRER